MRCAAPCRCSSRKRQRSRHWRRASSKASTPSASSTAAACIRSCELAAMQTHFSLAQLADPDLREADKILRACVHCGFCTATCPTYILLGDELDGPRGRIYLIKEMLEKNKPATAQVVKHIDRCLSCLSCITTCPSGVNYMHLVDHARQWIEETYTRPWHERLLRRLLSFVLPHSARFRAALAAGRLARPAARFLPARLRAMLELVPPSIPRPESPATKATGQRRL